MIKRISFSLFFLFAITLHLHAQKDSLNVNKSYWEDQLYFSLTYDVLKEQPSTLESSEVSYGFSTGYIKDLPVNKKGTIAFGIGVGYSYDIFSHDLVVKSNSFEVDSDVSSNRFKMYNIEFPIQFRWRTSDDVTYSFWRVYLGSRLSYNFFNKFQYVLEEIDYSFSNIESYNKLQTGIELSAGYGAFNFYMYYGLSPIFKDAFLNEEVISTSVAKFGLIFYLL